nr:unnamed protein product [Callosobruchus analis]
MLPREVVCTKRQDYKDTKLSNLIEIGTPKRKKRPDQNLAKNLNITVHYNVWTSIGKQKMCQKFKVFCISQKRIQTIFRQMKAGSGTAENRGDDRRSQKNVEKRLPADRIFGRCEKRIRSHSTIKSPEKYWKLYSQVGSVRKHGTDWEIYDVKSALSTFKKTDGISYAERALIKRITQRVAVKTVMFYRNDDDSAKYLTLIMKNKKIENLNFPKLPLNHEIKGKKLASLHNLLVQLSTEKWRGDEELQWLLPIFPEDLEALHGQDTDEDNTQEESNSNHGGLKV